jgi:hypothetical protein
MFRAVLLLIIRKFIQQLLCVRRLCWLAVGRIGVKVEFRVYQLLYIRVVPPDDEQ